MKTLKFQHHLAEQILAGEKTSTWRLFDDKNLMEGDELELIDSETGEVFARARIVHLKITQLGKHTDEDWDGHEKFASEEEMYKTYNEYYEGKVTPETEVKIIKFSLLVNDSDGV